MDYFIQVLANGLFIGTLYAQIAIGVTLIFGVLRVGDLAQGALYALSGYLVFALYQHLGIPYLLSVGFAVLACSLLSVAQGHFVYGPLRRIGIGPTFLGAIGLLVIVQNGLALTFSWEPQALRLPWSDSVLMVGPAILVAQKITLMLISALSIAGLALFLKKSDIGKALRATSQNPESAKLMGVNIAFVSAVAFSISGAFSATAGAIMASVWPLTPYAGALLVLKAFAIAIIAKQNIWMAALVALLVGVTESLVQGFWMARASDLVPFVLLAVILLLSRDHLSPEADQDGLPTLRRRSIRPVQQRAFLFTALAGALLLVFLVELIASNNLWLHLLIVMGLNILLVGGLDVLTGYAGIPSLAQAGLWGIGAYTTALLAVNWGWTFPTTLIASVLLTMLAASAIASLGLRLRGHWTSFTFLAGVVITLMINVLKDLTGGTEGMIGIPALIIALPGIDPISISRLNDKSVYLYLIIAAIMLMLFIRQRIANSRYGRAIMAAREDETLARSVGIPATRYKHLAFIMGAAFAGSAGSIYAHYLGYLNPDLFTYMQSFGLFVMNIVGGAGELLGPIFGPVFLTLFDEFTLFLHGSLSEIVFGTTLIVVLIFLPGGIAQGLRHVYRWLAKGRRTLR